MRYFQLDNAISQDECHLKLKCWGNNSIFGYNVNNLTNNTETCQNDFFTNNPNLRCKNGYGNTSGKTIDCDSRLRYDDPSQIRGPDRQQLFSRTFTAVPDLSSGTYHSEVESRLIHGHDTYADRECKSLTEVYFDRNQIFTPCVDEFVSGYSKSVAEDIRTGLPSRDFKQCPQTSPKTTREVMKRIKRKNIEN